MSERERIAEALERETFVVNDSKLRSLLHDAAALLRSEPVGEPVGWRPIETAPKDGTHILVWMRHEAYGFKAEGVDTARWTDHNGGGWVTWLSGTPTHWMPLPSAPTEGVEPCACGRRGPYPHKPHLPGNAPTPNCPEGYAMCDGSWCMVHGCGNYEAYRVVPPVSAAGEEERDG